MKKYKEKNLKMTLATFSAAAVMLLAGTGLLFGFASRRGRIIDDIQKIQKELDQANILLSSAQDIQRQYLKTVAINDEDTEKDMFKTLEGKLKKYSIKIVDIRKVTDEGQKDIENVYIRLDTSVDSFLRFLNELYLLSNPIVIDSFSLYVSEERKGYAGVDIVIRYTKRRRSDLDVL